MHRIPSLAAFLFVSAASVASAHDCRVMVFIDSIRLVTATDTIGDEGAISDFNRWDEAFVVVNRVSNADDPAATLPVPQQMVEGTTDQTDYLLFDRVVGVKEDRVDIYIRLRTTEIDLGAGNSDMGFGAHHELVVKQCRTVVRNLMMTVDVDQTGGPTDDQDKQPPVDGLLEIGIRVEVDP
jgi:hypothetical protein